jgi:dienelactone hydrolase
MRYATRVLTLVLLAAAGLAAASCSDDQTGSASLPVTTDVVSAPTTTDIWVTGPEGAGPWPIVYAMHGIGGTGEEMSDLASHLAGSGVVVFSPTYHTDWSTEAGMVEAARDGECGYRFVRGIAPERGGDLDRPVTFLGWSQGATAVLALGLTEDIDPSGRFVSCFENVPRPDVIVGVSGCFYEYEGKPVDVDASEWGNDGVRLILVAGDEDTTCPAWQSRRAARDLRVLGYDVRLVVLDGADHSAPVFHPEVDGGSEVRTDDPPGDRLVRVVLGAIRAADAANAHG